MKPSGDSGRLGRTRSRVSRTSPRCHTGPRNPLWAWSASQDVELAQEWSEQAPRVAADPGRGVRGTPATPTPVCLFPRRLSRLWLRIPTASYTPARHQGARSPTRSWWWEPRARGRRRGSQRDLGPALLWRRWTWDPLRPPPLPLSFPPPPFLRPWCWAAALSLPPRVSVDDVSKETMRKRGIISCQLRPPSRNSRVRCDLCAWRPPVRVRGLLACAPENTALGVPYSDPGVVTKRGDAEGGVAEQAKPWPGGEPQQTAPPPLRGAVGSHGRPGLRPPSRETDSLLGRSLGLRLQHAPGLPPLRKPRHLDNVCLCPPPLRRTG